MVTKIENRVRVLRWLRAKRANMRQDGGALIHNSSEEEQGCFDATWRKLHGCLGQPQP